LISTAVFFVVVQATLLLEVTHFVII